MKKHRIPDYFGRPQDPPLDPTGFFKLPFHVRRLIYLKAGLVTGRLIDLNFGDRPYEDQVCFEDKAHDRDVDTRALLPHQIQPSPYVPGQFEAQPPLNLLRVCRIMRNDAENIFYAENHFLIAQRCPRGLAPLENLSIAALGAMQSLVVRLTPCACRPGHCVERRLWKEPTWKEFGEKLHTPHDKPLGVVARWDRNLVRQWQRVCNRLASHATLDEFSLYVFCKVKGPAAAQQVLAPLSTLVGIQACTISFGGCEDGTLRRMATTTIQQIVGKPSDRKPFRFFDLPQELQLQILEQTPLGQRKEFPHRAGKNHDSFHPWDDQLDGYRSPAFCARGMTTLGLACGCCAFPTSYLLVSREFGKLAKKILYSQGPLVLHLWRVSPRHPVGAANPLFFRRTSFDEADLSFFYWFLRRLPSLNKLSHLVLVFPPMTPNYLTNRQSGWARWLELIDLLYSTADLSILTLEVHMADYPLLDQQGLLRRCDSDSQRLEKPMHELYSKLLSPLQKLKRLKAFFVYLAWPLHPEKKALRREYERDFEKMVKGHTYDSTERGKLLNSRYVSPLIVHDASSLLKPWNFRNHRVPDILLPPWNGGY